MNLSKKIKSIKKNILDSIYPPVCINCKKRIENQEKLLCDNCFNLIHINNSFMCPKCNARKTNYKIECHNTKFILAPACFYHEPIPALIHSYKYKRLQSIKKILSSLIIVYINNLNLEIKDFYISYIPLHHKKERRRGFNQSKELAKIVSNYFNIPIIKTLEKIEDKESQTTIRNSWNRFTNVKNTMQLNMGVEIKNKKILLIDDISTSGATLNEASKILKSEGAKKIIGLVVAKAI